MAVLSKIRQRSFFLIVIIALALFAFVLTDVIKSGTFSSDANNIGSVDGKDINAQSFMQKVAQMQENSKQQGQNMSSTQAMNSLWEQEVRGILLDKEIEKTGLRLGGDHMLDALEPYFSQNPQYLNEAGKFDEKKFKEFVKSIKNDENKARWKQWEDFEAQVEKSKVEEMYNNMIRGAVYVTNAEGKFKHVAENKKVEFNYVTVAYTTVNDDQAKVSDDEIMAYMKKNEKKYKSDATSSIEYVIFENTPSDTDSKLLETEIYEILNGKVTATDTIPSFKSVSNIGDFVSKNSAIPFDSTYLTKKQLPLEYQEQLMNLVDGEVFGPYVADGYQKVSRLVDRKSNASVKASHILISYAGTQIPTATRTKEEAQALANDLLAQVKANPASFGSLAAQNSDDPGSKDKGGEYDDIQKDQMVKPFNDFIFNNSVGSLGVVETDFGFHVIKVLDKYSSVLLGTVAKKIEPSNETINKVFEKASKLEEEVASGKSLADVAKGNGLTVVPAKSVKPSDEYIQGFGANREVVRWMFSDDSNVNDVKRFDIPQGYLIAKLTNKNDTGFLDMETARQSVGVVLMNEKKAEIIKKKMTGASLDAIAKSTGGSVLSSGPVAIGNSNIPNIGAEPKVVGAALKQGKDKMSSTIDGNTGVFVVKTINVTEAPVVTSYSSYIEQEKSQQTGASQQRAYQAIKEKAEIKDGRGRF